MTLKLGFPWPLRSRFSTVLATTRFKASIPASLGDIPLRIDSTIKNEPRENRFASPRPVEPAAPTSPSTYNPAPGMGESPTRPGIFQASPLVVVTPDTSPLEFTPLQLIVPQKCSGSIFPSATISSPTLRPNAQRSF